MFNPISLQTIRQALSWANLRPRNIVQRSCKIDDDGRQTAVYSMYFELSTLKRYRADNMAHWGGIDVLILKADMRECFMSDITVASAHWAPGDTAIEIMLLVTLTPEQSIIEGELAWLID